MHFCGTLCLSGFFEEQRRPGVVMKARAKFGGFEGLACGLEVVCRSVVLTQVTVQSREQRVGDACVSVS
jgi:hypothetical protein